MSWETFRILVELQVIVVVLIDLSGGVEEFKHRLARWLKVREVSVKPLDCSLCMYHWTALLVLLCSGKLTLVSYMVICLLAMATSVTKELIERILFTMLWLIHLKIRRK